MTCDSVSKHIGRRLRLAVRLQDVGSEWLLEDPMLARVRLWWALKTFAVSGVLIEASR